MSEDAVDAVLAALAHPVRRRLIDLLVERGGRCVWELAAPFSMTRIGVMKHLAVLERAGLVHSERHGRERRLWFNAMPIQSIYDRWTNQYGAFWASRLADIKERAESKSRRRAKRCA
ncbi:MAG: metalloregulator ArsR/SmtB family transcription factor [Phycisphaerales bacterium]|jgi:DNA-binding transcriptional ArsR family regulator